MLWWVKMQPTWRGGKSLIKTSPPDQDWEPLIHGGPNGIFVVVLALCWWIQLIDAHNYPSELSVVVNDAKWVLSELIGVLSAEGQMGKKHALEEPCQNEGNSKK